MLLALGFLKIFQAEAAEPTAIDVRFVITDSADRPLRLVPLRVVIGAAPNWQKADAGHRFTTDEAGAHRFSVAAPIERRSRKMPTNFADSLFSRPKPTDFLQVGTEFEYAGQRWLHVIEIHRFEDGTTLCEHPAIFAPDERGNFARAVERMGRDWKLTDASGRLVTGSGIDVVSVMLQPEPGDSVRKRWTLTLKLRRVPEPIDRDSPK